MALRKFLFQNPTGLYHEEQATTDELELGKLTLSGVGGIAIDAGAQRITNVLDPTADQDAATKAYVDAAGAGVDWKASVRVATTADINLSSAPAAIDGVTLAQDDRVLVKDQSTGSQNGIYVFNGSGNAMTRSTDADANVEVTSGLSTFVNEGTTHADSGWVLITEDPITVGTTALAFTQFTGLGQITAGLGLIKTGNVLDIGDGAGIAVAADAISVDLATDPALEFDVGGATGKLRFKPDTSRGLNRDASGAYVALAATPGLEFAAGLLSVLDDPNGGLQIGAAGLAIKIDDTPDTLDVDGDGLKVVGLPSLFKINGTAVGNTVTAPNLDTVTNGSNADALHTHSIAEVPKVAETWTASGAITKGDGVYVSGSGAVSTGDCTDVNKSYIHGVADANIADTASGKIVKTGLVTGVLSGASPGARYFLGASGQPVLAGGLPSGARTIQLGVARTTTDLAVHLFDYGKKA